MPLTPLPPNPTRRYGHGWGIRVMQSIQFGCIPVIIQDHVYQAFEVRMCLSQGL